MQTSASESTSLPPMRKKSKSRYLCMCAVSVLHGTASHASTISPVVKEIKLFNLLTTNIVVLCHREALISRPDELSYGILKIQATKVRLYVPHSVSFCRK